MVQIPAGLPASEKNCPCSLALEANLIIATTNNAQPSFSKFL